MMTKEEQVKILDTHYQGCLEFWKRQGEDEITAMGYALNDISRVRHDPYSPHREPMDVGIVREVAEKYRVQMEDTIREAHHGRLEEENDDHIRRCDHCKRPMKDGYYLGGEYACSDECALVLYDGDRARMEEDLAHADEEDGECYWTEWESVYFD